LKKLKEIECFVEQNEESEESKIEDYIAQLHRELGRITNINQREAFKIKISTLKKCDK